LVWVGLLQACPSNFSETPSLKCKALYSEMEDSLGEFNTYNIYDQCPSSRGQEQQQQGQNSARGGYTMKQLLDAKHGSEEDSRSGAKKAAWVSGSLKDDLHPHPELNSKLGTII
jgi:hypothetical protein